MHSPLTAVVLCLFAHAAAAQCVNTAPLARDAHRGAETFNATRTAATAPGTLRQGGELIKTAAAGTRDRPPGPPVATHVLHASPSTAPDDEEPPSRSHAAMLLAALAIMSGIVLRRFGATMK